MACSFPSSDVAAEVDRCCVSSRSIRPACSLYSDGQEASTAVAVVAERETVSVLEEQFMLCTRCSF